MSVTRSSLTKGIPTKTYIAMRSYQNDIFTYTESVVDSIAIGTLTKPTGATSLTCPKGSFLRETGRRLYPGAYPGISTMMVGVFDFNTGLNGLIDPTSFAFTPQTTDRPYYIDSAGYNPNSADAPNRSDQGPPVYTHGDVDADGNLIIGGTANITGTTTVTSNMIVTGPLVVNGQIRSVGPNSTRITVTTPPATNNIDISRGSFFFFETINQNITLTCNNFNVGDKLYLELDFVGTRTVTFSTGFASASASGSFGPTTGLWLVCFVCDGAHMIEASRSQNLYVAP